MKKLTYLFGLSFFALILAKPMYARIVGTNPTGGSADEICNGGRIRGNTVIAATEDCQDFNGDFIPTGTTVNSGWNQSLGISAFPWYQLYLGAGGVTNSGLVVTSPTQVGTTGNGFGIFASTTIPVSASYEVLFPNNGSALVITATPSIATTTAPGVPYAPGTQLILDSTSTLPISLQTNSSLAGSDVVLVGNSSGVVSSTQTLECIFNGPLGMWKCGNL